MTAAPLGRLALRDGSAAQAPAVLGAWSIAPASPSDSHGALVFAAAGPPGEAEPSWLVELPADRAEADRTLVAAEVGQAAVAPALRLAERRLLAEATRAGTRSAASFAAPAFDDPGAGQPENGLRAALADVGLGAGGGAPEAFTVEAFGPIDRVRDLWVAAAGFWDEVRRAWAGETGEWTGSLANFIDALDRARRLFGLRSWVESTIDGVGAARTAIGADGDAVTAWRRGLPADERRLHARAVALALASREALLRTIALAVRGAALLAGMLAGPAGALLALPAVWRFVDDVVAEARGLRTRWQEA